MSDLIDAVARERAAQDLDTSFLVEASAGSGKTTLLVSRILSWVRSGRATLPEIVAITFTEKAAAELRLRVREAVEAARPDAEAAERARLDQALADLELAPIRTIHAFCGDLLRQRPVEAGIDPGFRIAAPLEAALLFEETWERWLEPAAAEAPPALHEAIALGIPLETLRELAGALVGERDLLAGLPPLRPEAFADLNREVRAMLRKLAAGAPAGKRAEDDRLVRHLADLLAWVEQTDSLGETEQIGAILTELPLRNPSRLGAQTVWGGSPRINAGSRGAGRDRRPRQGRPRGAPAQRGGGARRLAGRLRPRLWRAARPARTPGLPRPARRVPATCCATGPTSAATSSSATGRCWWTSSRTPIPCSSRSPSSSRRTRPAPRPPAWTRSAWRPAGSSWSATPSSRSTGSAAPTSRPTSGPGRSSRPRARS